MTLPMDLADRTRGGLAVEDGSHRNSETKAEQEGQDTGAGPDARCRGSVGELQRPTNYLHPGSSPNPARPTSTDRGTARKRQDSTEV